MKRLIVLCLALCLLISMLSACKTAQDASATTTRATTTTKEASQTAETTKPAETVPPQKNPIVIMCNEHPSQAIIADAPVHLELQKLTGVTFELQPIPSADYDAKVQTLLATNSMPDVLKLNYRQMSDYAATGMFVNLSEKMEDLPYYKSIVDGVESTKFMKVNGSLYFFISMIKYSDVNGNFPIIREDLLAKTGKSMPTNFDELYDVLLAFKEYDPTSIPWGTRGGANHLCDRIGYAFGVGPNGVYFDPDVDGGRYVFNPINPRFKEFLAYLNKCYENDILDPDYTVTVAQQWQENLSSGKSYFYFDNGSFVTNFNTQLQKTDPSQKFVPMKTLTNPFGQTRNRVYAGQEFAEQGWTVSADSKEIPAALRLFDYMYSPEGSDLTNYGIEGEHYTKVGDENVLKPEVVAYHIANDNDPWRGFHSKIGGGLLDIAVYVDQRTQYPFMSEEVIGFYKFWGEDKALQAYHFLPPLNPDETEEVKQITSALSTITTSELDKFIMGLRPISEYDAFRQDLINAGAQRLEQIYQEASKRLD